MTEHYFSDRPAAPATSLTSIPVRLGGRDLVLHGADQVFSGRRLDKATAILLDEVPSPPAGHVLDLGCGWGPIAIDAALRNPDATVWAVDVNHRALDLASRNATRAGASNVTVLPADEALTRARDEGVQFAAIWSNPPVRIGKEGLRELLVTWFALLAPDAEATFVMGKHLGADSMAAWLTDQGFPTRKVASKKGFRILAARCASAG
ncbi:MAG: methyltransferase [Actinomycetaceae bacterium]|nr:methyltransferase [Actinomycetaceae bacterium]MDU0970022.1 methyltransferase [Actinomycetaceae bacterium]